MATREAIRAKLPPPTRRRAIRVRAGATLEEGGDLVGVSSDDYIDVLDDLRIG